MLAKRFSVFELSAVLTICATPGDDARSAG
jgi:hypothetical protein